VTDRLQRLRSSLRGLPVAGLLLGLLALVALASRSGHQSASGRALPGPPPAFLDYAFTAGLVLAAGAVLFALRRVRLPQPRQVRSHWYVLWTILTIAAVTVIAGLVARELHVVHHAGRGGGASGGGAAHRLSPAQPGTERHLHFRWEAGALVLALIVLATAAVVLLRRRAPTAEEPEESLPEALGVALDESLDDLRSEPDARRAVIAAYARAESVLARHGLPRRPAETPLEYLSRVLLELRVRAAAVLELTELFERAKFSAHRIDSGMKDDAIAALVAVREDLRAAA
jgi:uncharacterized protein DUF4129